MREWLGNLLLTWGVRLLRLGSPSAIQSRPVDEDDQDMPGMFHFNLPNAAIELDSSDIIEEEQTSTFLDGSIEQRVQAATNRRREF